MNPYTLLLVILSISFIAHTSEARVNPGDIKPTKPMLDNPNMQNLQNYHATDSALSGIGTEPFLLNPKQMIDMAKDLRLTDKQKVKLNELGRRHTESAQALGQQISEKEQRLNALLNHKKVDEQTLRQLVMETARLRGELRLLFLKTHLEVKQVLLPKQLEKFYNRKKEKPAGKGAP
jgi:Spy/CpxP family protein refolding chaperone